MFNKDSCTHMCGGSGRLLFDLSCRSVLRSGTQMEGVADIPGGGSSLLEDASTSAFICRRSALPPHPCIPNPLPVLYLVAICLGKRRSRRQQSGSNSLSARQIKDVKRFRKTWPSFRELPANSDKGFCSTTMKKQELL